MRLTWLPDVLRAAGLIVVEDGPRLVDGKMDGGWRTRGTESWGPVRGVICHATASARTSTAAGDTRVLWQTGSVTAPNPISQMYLARNGDWYVGASGRCHHVLIGDKGPHKGYGNSALIGVEAANDNRGEPWSPHMLDSYQRGVAAICGHQGWPADVAVAHREHQTGKSDPLGIDMIAFRESVAAILAGTAPPATGGDDMLTPEEHAWAYSTLSITAAMANGADTASSMNVDGTTTPISLLPYWTRVAAALTPAQLAAIGAAARAGAEAGAPTAEELEQAAFEGAQRAEGE